MSDNIQERITILCTEDFKQEVKAEISKKGIKRFKDGYFKIFELGWQEFKKSK
jgi:hypothetical protein